MIRSFVAIELPADLSLALGELQAQLKGHIDRTAGPEVRVQWVKPASIHLTLKFFGDIDDAQVPAIQLALEAVANAQQVFIAGVQGLGAFPDVRAPRVIWVGFADHRQALQELAAAVETALEPLGFPAEARPFSPHLTVARIKERGRNVGRALATSRLLEQQAQVGLLPVNAIALMKSERTPSGSIYTKLCHLPLKEA